MTNWLWIYLTIIIITSNVNIVHCPLSALAPLGPVRDRSAIHIYIYIYIYMYCMCIYIYRERERWLDMYVCIYIYIYKYDMCIYIYIERETHIYIYIYIYIYGGARPSLRPISVQDSWSQRIRLKHNPNFKGGILVSIDNVPERLSQQFLVGMILAGRSGVFCGRHGLQPGYYYHDCDYQYYYHYSSYYN